MSAVKNSVSLSELEYLQYELTREIKHELIAGQAYAMAGASRNHGLISSNTSRKFANHLENTSCMTFIADMKVKANTNFFYPDVMVVCNEQASDEYYTDSPSLIVEVLSKSTRKHDETTKLLSYINIPSLQEYVLIQQDFVDIQVIRRNEGWLPKHYFLGDDITFESIALTLPVEDIYHRVKNEDMLDFLQEKSE